jgi:hypothetical protein
VARPTHLSCARVESRLSQYAPPEPSPEHSFRFSYLSVKLTADRGLPLESCATAVDSLVCALSRSAPSVSLFGFLLPGASPVSFWEPRQGTADASPRVFTQLASECFVVFVSIDSSRSTRPCRITSFLGRHLLPLAGPFSHLPRTPHRRVGLGSFVLGLQRSAIFCGTLPREDISCSRLS